MPNWSVAQTKALYNIEHWSDGFFDIDEQGHLIACPHRKKTDPCLSFKSLIEQLYVKGFSLPVLVRFNDILHQRVRDLIYAFDQAILEQQFRGHYTPAYPIKVNQQRHVIMEILRAKPGYIALEAGSKPELMAVLGVSEPGSMILCNGYKDRQYVRLALIATKLGHRVHIIVEKSSELDLILQEAQQLNVKPFIGIRIRPSSISAGKWQNTGGERGKFGLSAMQVIHAIEKLKSAAHLDCLQLLHFHMGSQVANIKDIQQVMHECARFYAELQQMGANIIYVDVGGGLGVDYEGTHSRSFCSINYSIQEYANNVVSALKAICDEKGIPHPHIISESGRAMAAHHAVLITNIIDQEAMNDISDEILIEKDDHRILHYLFQRLEQMNAHSAIETYHDASYGISELQSLYIHGLIDLKQRAKAEYLYRKICIKVREFLATRMSMSHLPLMNELNQKLAHKYFCNFSLFQSIPDSWAIDQIFPVIPLTSLHREPDARVTLHDLTCDSDGTIKSYVDGQGIESTLPIAHLDKEHEIILGIFLVGAYQEILGDMHNLFGDTHSVHVEINANGECEITQPKHGDRISDVLKYVDFNPEKLLQSYEKQCIAAGLTPDEQRAYLNELTQSLYSYTYLGD